MKPSRLRFLWLASLLILAVTLAGYAGNFSWFLELFAHFRPHYAVVALVLLVIALARFAPALVVVNLCSVLLNAWLIYPYLGSAPESAVAQGDTIRLLSANVSVRNSDVSRLAAIIDRYQPDLVLLLELTPSGYAAIESYLGEHYPYRHANPRNDHFGSGLFSRLALDDVQLIDLGYRDVPGVSALVHAPTATFRMLGVHLEWPLVASFAASRNTMLRKASAYLNGLDGNEHRVFMGDLNLTPWTLRYQALLRETGLHDSAIGAGLQHTFPALRYFPGIIIDHCLVSRGLQVRSRTIGPDFGSDHYPLVVDLVVGAGS